MMKIFIYNDLLGFTIMLAITKPAVRVMAMRNISMNWAVPAVFPCAVATRPRKPMLPLTSTVIAGSNTIEPGFSVFHSQVLAKTPTKAAPIRFPILLSNQSPPYSTPK